MKLTFLVAALLFTVTLARADNVSYEVTATNFLTLGDFGFTVTFPNFVENEISTGSWNAAQSPTLGAGCKINRITILDDNSFDISFQPLCQGVFDSATFGFEIPRDAFGTFTFTQPNYDALGNPNGTLEITERIFPSNLPVTTPEPRTVVLLAAGMMLGACGLRRLSGNPDETWPQGKLFFLVAARIPRVWKVT